MGPRNNEVVSDTTATNTTVSATQTAKPRLEPSDSEVRQMISQLNTTTPDVQSKKSQPEIEQRLGNILRLKKQNPVSLANNLLPAKTTSP